MSKSKNAKRFGTRWGFILASVGSAVGMANVWGFPNKMGQNGGGAFLLIYLLFVVLFGCIALPAEFAVGRWAGTGTLGSYARAWRSRSPKAEKAGGALGWLPLAGSMCIAIGYAVIVSYVLKALVDSVTGTLMTVDTTSWFQAFSTKDFSVVPYHIIVVVGTLLTLLLGANSIEKTNKVMMPLFDTIAALVASLVIIPACFSYGLDVGAGPGLLFVTLPEILQDIPMGRLFAVILYVAMIFAGVSSLQNMFEAVAESLLHRFPKLSRKVVLVLLAVVCLGAGIGMETISKWGPWMDLVSIYIIPIGATLGAVSWFFIMKKDDLLAAVNTGSGKRHGALWYNVGRFVYVPLAALLCGVALIAHVAF